MITEKELHEAIAECQGARNPDAKTCLKLASFYTILDHIKEEEKVPAQREIAIPQYSYAKAPEAMKYESETEFGEITSQLDEYTVMEMMDELMSTLSVVEPRLYASVMRKLKGQN